MNQVKEKLGSREWRKMNPGKEKNGIKWMNKNWFRRKKNLDQEKGKKNQGIRREKVGSREWIKNESGERKSGTKRKENSIKE